MTFIAMNEAILPKHNEKPTIIKVLAIFKKDCLFKISIVCFYTKEAGENIKEVTLG